MDSVTLLSDMLAQTDWGQSLLLFMRQGGPVLWWLAAIVALFWLLIIERVMFMVFSFPRQQKRWLDNWQRRQDHDSWYARTIRDGWLGQARLELTKHLNLIKLLVALFPMLGLLGTVTGMISVFDLMANQGSSDPRLMASGISMATLPTMAGMVAALVGMFVHARLVKACLSKEQKLEKQLRSQQ